MRAYKNGLEWRSATLLLAAIAPLADGTRLLSAHKAGWSRVSHDATYPAPPPTPPGATPSCTVRLVKDFPFKNWNGAAKATYMPSCAGTNWQQVVLRFRAYVNAGEQFDRMGSLWLSGVELLRLTTPEPEYSRGVTWSVDKDVSEYLDLFGRKGNIVASIPTITNEQYRPVIMVNASLDFYGDLPLRPQLGPTTHGVALLQTGVGSVAKTEILPVFGKQGGGPPDGWCGSAGKPQVWAKSVTVDSKHASRMWLDVKASPHSCEEFWHSGGASGMDGCGRGLQREIHVHVDGLLAGAALPFPVLYTGANDPRLWKPLVGVDALDIPAQRFDLSPFIGLMSDGQGHNISVSIQNGGDFWCLSGVLVMPQDGSVRNAPTGRPVIVNGNVGGVSLGEIGKRYFTVEGSVSHGSERETTHRAEISLDAKMTQGGDHKLNFSQVARYTTKPSDGPELVSVASSDYEFFFSNMPTSAMQKRLNRRCFKVSTGPESCAVWEEKLDTEDSETALKGTASYKVWNPSSKSNEACFSGYVSTENSYVSGESTSETQCEWPYSGSTFCPHFSCAGFGVDGMPARLLPSARLWEPPQSRRAAEHGPLRTGLLEEYCAPLDSREENAPSRGKSEIHSRTKLKAMLKGNDSKVKPSHVLQTIDDEQDDVDCPKGRHESPHV